MAAQHCEEEKLIDNLITLKKNPETLNCCSWYVFSRTIGLRIEREGGNPLPLHHLVIRYLSTH